jgi:hypothetical protein
MNRSLIKKPIEKQLRENLIKTLSEKKKEMSKNIMRKATETFHFQHPLPILQTTTDLENFLEAMREKYQHRKPMYKVVAWANKEYRLRKSEYDTKEAKNERAKRAHTFDIAMSHFKPFVKENRRNQQIKMTFDEFQFVTNYSPYRDNPFSEQNWKPFLCEYEKRRMNLPFKDFYSNDRQ